MQPARALDPSIEGVIDDGMQPYILELHQYQLDHLQKNPLPPVSDDTDDEEMTRKAEMARDAELMRVLEQALQAPAGRLFGDAPGWVCAHCGKDNPLRGGTGAVRC
eukprot:SAG31_NODE_5494_length_2502_cov_3.044944_2_plen_106_part_00